MLFKRGGTVPTPKDRMVRGLEQRGYGTSVRAWAYRALIMLNGMYHGNPRQRNVLVAEPMLVVPPDRVRKGLCKRFGHYKPSYWYERMKYSKTYTCRTCKQLLDRHDRPIRQEEQSNGQ